MTTPMDAVERVARLAEPDVWMAIEDVGNSPSDRSRWREASMTRASMWVAAYRQSLEDAGMVVVPRESVEALREVVTNGYYADDTSDDWTISGAVYAMAYDSIIAAEREAAMISAAPPAEAK